MAPLLLVLLPHFALAGAGASDEPETKPGMHRQILELTTEKSLRYTLSIPEGYEPGEPRALVLALHYSGRVTPFYGKGFLEQLVEPGLRSLGAILVAPDCRSRSWANESSEAEVLELVDFVLENYAIDRKRILVTGYSMGAAGTWYMAARHPEIFSLALPVAGSPPESVASGLDKMPVYAVNSQDDGVVPLRPTVEALQAMDARGVLVELDVVRGITHFEVPRFVRHLRTASEWVQKQWEE